MHAYAMGEPNSAANARERIPLSPLGSPRKRKENFFPHTISMAEVVKRQTCRAGEGSSDKLEMITVQYWQLQYQN